MTKEKFVDKLGRDISIILDEDAYQAVAYHNGMRIGHIEWDTRSIGFDAYDNDTYGALLTHIFLDEQPGFTNAGIGTCIVKMIHEYTGMPVLVARDYGITRLDGAHPTGNASTFYSSLVRKKLAYYEGLSDRFDEE